MDIITILGGKYNREDLETKNLFSHFQLEMEKLLNKMSIFLGNFKKGEKLKTNIDTKGFLKTDGSVSMAGNLDLGNYAIDNLKTYPEGNKNAASKKYVDDECGKLLDLDANRSLNGDLNMNDNSIIGIYDINADNSVPSKKFVKDENSKQNTKITQNENQAHLNATRNLTMQNDVNELKTRPLYSHYGTFMYQNPVSGVYKEPYQLPAGHPWEFFWLSPDYNEDTTISILGLNCNTDSALPTTNVNFSVEGIFHSRSGGYNTKVILSGKNIHPNRVVGENEYYFSHPSFTMKFKDFHNNWSVWHKFYLKVAVPWSGNETRLTFFVTYYK